MPSSPSELLAALRGTPLDGRAVREAAGDVLVMDVPAPGQWFDSWLVARGLLDATGRWPVAFTSFEASAQDWIDVVQDDAVGEPCVARDEVLARDPWTEFRLADESYPPADLPLYARAGQPPFVDLTDEVTAALPAPVSTADLDAWMYDRVRQDQDLRAVSFPAYLVGKGQWFQPDNVSIAFLPTEDSWMAPAWLSYYGALDPVRRVALCAALREWHELWGAEVASSWETMLQLIATRPPQPGPAALELARQHLAVGSSLQMPAWTLALALPESDAWFLHDRP